MRLILLAALAASMLAGSADAGRVATSYCCAPPFDGVEPPTRDFQFTVSIKVDGELVERLTVTNENYVSYSANVRGRRVGPLYIENHFIAFLPHLGAPEIFRDYGELRIHLGVHGWDDPPFDSQVSYAIENYDDYVSGGAPFALHDDPSTVGIASIHRNRRLVVDFWTLSHVEGPWKTTPLEIFHGSLGGQEILVSMDEYGWLPIDEVLLVSPKRGAVRRSRNVLRGAALGVAAVPEPATIGLLILGALLCPRPRHFRATAS